MSATIVNAKLRQQLVPIEAKRGRTQLLPVYQSVGVLGYEEYVNIDIRPAAATTALSNGDDLIFDLERNTCKNVKDLVLKIQLTCATAAVQCVPGPYLIEYILVEANRGSGDELLRIYPEQIIMHLMSMPELMRDRFEELCMCKFTRMKNYVRLTEGPSLQVGDVKNVYIPLNLSMFSHALLHFQHLTEDLRFRIKLRSGFNISGTATNVTVSNVSMLVKQDNLPPEDERKMVDSFEKTGHVVNYLDVIRVTDNTKTLTASSETKFDLQNVVGKSPFLLFVIKGATAPAASTRTLFKYTTLGDKSKVNLKSPSDEALISTSNGLDSRYLDYLFSMNYQEKPLFGFYQLQFTNDVHKAQVGVLDGFYQFTGAKDSLSVTFDAAPTAEVQTVTLTNAANDAGYYQLAIGGDMTNALAFNETAANMKTAFDALSPMADRLFGVTFSGTAEATFTATFGTQDGRVSDEIGKIKIIPSSLSDGGVAEIGSSAVTTYGKLGWTTGSAYQCEIFVYYYKRLHISREGRLSCETI